MPPEAETSPRLSVRDRLLARRAALPAALSTKLPVSELDVTYPPRLSHDAVMAAAKMAGKKNKHAVAKIIIAQTCLFEGERLTHSDVGELLDNRDVTHLTDLLLGKDDEDDDAEEGAGN